MQCRLVGVQRPKKAFEVTPWNRLPIRERFERREDVTVVLRLEAYGTKGYLDPVVSDRTGFEARVELVGLQRPGVPVQLSCRVEVQPLAIRVFAPAFDDFLPPPVLPDLRDGRANHLRHRSELHHPLADLLPDHRIPGRSHPIADFLAEGFISLELRPQVQGIGPTGSSADVRFLRDARRKPEPRLLVEEPRSGRLRPQPSQDQELKRRGHARQPRTALPIGGRPSE